MGTPTPGPWFLARDETTVLCGRRDDPEIIATCEVDDIMAVRWDDCRPNARLICAAPDLLDALEQAVEWMSRVPESTYSVTIAKARAAVRKAKGDGEPDACQRCGGAHARDICQVTDPRRLRDVEG